MKPGRKTTIDIAEALRLYWIWRNWREVAQRLVRQTGQRHTTDAVQAKVRRHDRRAEKWPQ